VLNESICKICGSKLIWLYPRAPNLKVIVSTQGGKLATSVTENSQDFQIKKYIPWFASTQDTSSNPNKNAHLFLTPS
jgi:hypothetical protein